MNEDTQEYLGHSIQLVYLAPMWKETLDQDTYYQGAGSTVARTTDGTIFHQPITAVAGVSNVGTDTNWNGLNDVRRFQKIWDQQEGKIDPDRFKAVQYKLREQLRDAIWWRDGVLLYFQSVNELPIPYELERPLNKLEDLMQYRLRMGNSSLPPGVDSPGQQISPINPGPQPRQMPP